MSNKTFFAKMLSKHKWIHHEKPVTVKIPMKSDTHYQRELEQAGDTTDEAIAALET